MWCFRNMWLWALSILVPTHAFLIVIPDTTPVGTVIFKANLDGPNNYKLDSRRTGNHVHRFVHVDYENGEITVKRPLECSGAYYTNPMSLWVEAWADNNPSLDYATYPLRILVSGAKCDHVRELLKDVASWRDTISLSISLPDVSSTGGEAVCVKRSQVIVRVPPLLPKTMQKCRLSYNRVSDPRFAMEKTEGDLVSLTNVCLGEITRVTVWIRFHCADIGESYEQGVMLLLHNDAPPEEGTVRRIRRQMTAAAPYFERPLIESHVKEEEESGTSVTTVTATDPEGSSLSYSIKAVRDSRSENMFKIDPSSGLVSTTTKLDRELMDEHYFRVIAVDQTSHPPRTATTTLKVSVIDTNDHDPIFEREEYIKSITEGPNSGSTILKVRATDADAGANSDITYTLLESSDPNQIFRLDPRTGELESRLPLDREKQAVYHLTVQAEDGGPPNDRRSTTAKVKITVLDDNDNYPLFTESTYTVEVPEDISSAASPVIAHIRADDADAGENGEVRYAIIGGNTAGNFAIDSLTGEVRVVSPLDHEGTKSYRLVIRAQDSGSPPRSKTTQLLVNVRDVNDNAPRFYTPLFQETVQENVPVGYSIVRVQAFDSDEGENSVLTYRLEGGGSQMPVSVDPSTGWVVTQRELDREDYHHYTFTVIAADQGDPPRSATATVVLQIQDQNDNDPVFSPKNYEVAVSETESPGTPVVTVTAADKDEDPRLHYAISSGNQRGRFSITAQNGRGVISLAQPLDFKQERRYVLTVTATDAGGRHDSATVYVNVTDANTFPPVFENTPYTATVFEDAPAGSTVLVVSAADSDSGENARITYSLSGESQPEFTIHPNTGAITTTRLLDRELQGGYLLTVTARDNGKPPLADTTDVEITIIDVNDNAPVFSSSSYRATLSEEESVGSSILQIKASDADASQNGFLHYTFDGGDDGDGTFVLDPTSGVLRTAKLLDREAVAKYELVAYAVDNGDPPRSSSVTVAVNLDDVNDNAPIFDTDHIQLYITENSPIGSTVGEIRARDPDSGRNAIIEYSISGGADAADFMMVSHPSEGKAELVTRVELDYESPKKKYHLEVKATSDPLSSYVPVTIHVVDVNDNKPTLNDFRIVFNNFKDHFPVGSIGTVPAVDADVTDQLNYRIVSGNKAGLLDISRDTGEVTLSPALNSNVATTATMRVAVTDGLNEVTARMTLQVLYVTESMLYNSITIRLSEMTQEAFLSHLLEYFIDALSAIIPCPKENIFVFSIMDDTDVSSRVLNVSVSAKRQDLPGEQFYSQQYLKERIYLHRRDLETLAAVKVLPFDDNLCVTEPCGKFDECVTILKFGNASDFISSNSVFFRPIYPVTTHACRCPKGFTGMMSHYECDTEVDLCYSSPCGHHGTCMRKEGGYTCLCVPGYTGVNCEVNMLGGPCVDGVCRHGSRCAPITSNNPLISSAPKTLASRTQKKEVRGFTCSNCTRSLYHTSTCELRARRFTKGSFLTFPALTQRHRMNLKISFATRRADGLLLYNGRYNEMHDFISLELVDGTVVFSYNLGDDTTRVSASIPQGVNDGNWHTVTIDYLHRVITLSIDDCDTAVAVKYGETVGGYYCANRTEKVLPMKCSNHHIPCNRFLDLTGPLQIGGLPTLPESERLQHQYFHGCISDLYIDNKFIDLDSFVADNGTYAGCPEKQRFCQSHPCRNGGSCQEVFGSFQCDCIPGFGGHDCSEKVEVVKHLEGGYLLFTPKLQAIRLPWRQSLGFRTRGLDGLLLRATLGTSAVSLIEIVDGYLGYRFGNTSIRILDIRVNDGKWHNIEIKWMKGEVWVNLDYGDYELTRHSQQQIVGLYVDKISVGGVDPAEAKKIDYFHGCIKDVRLGSDHLKPIIPSHEGGAVSDGCTSPDVCSHNNPCPRSSICKTRWQGYDCDCNKGYYGDRCMDVCVLNPCSNNGSCVSDVNERRGYRCDCKGTQYTGEYCEEPKALPCPNTWWGYPVCGPCNCDTDKGYAGECDKETGECRCQTNHYQKESSSWCHSCDCYLEGSLSSSCDQFTGQCKCRPGVIGRRCDQCANPSAQVHISGCQIVYDGCPKNFHSGVWWGETVFGGSAVQQCPDGATGQASRFCHQDLGWADPDMFNCVSNSFSQLKDVLAQLEEGSLEISSFVAIKVSSDLNNAVSGTPEMWGSDVLITSRLLILLLEHESIQQGLNLTHRQDKHYIQNLVESASIVLQEKYLEHWQRINGLQGFGGNALLQQIEKYTATMASTQGDTFTQPFEIPTENIVFGMDTITPQELYGTKARVMVMGHEQPVNRLTIPESSTIMDTDFPEVEGESSVIVPKYSNYLRNQQQWSHGSSIRIPLSLLNIPNVRKGESSTVSSIGSSKAVVSYAMTKSLGMLLPGSFDRSVEQRWGVGLTARAPVFTVAVHSTQLGEDNQLKEKFLEGELGEAVRLQFRVEGVGKRSNPQCVSWVVDEMGEGVWSRRGCFTSDSYDEDDIFANVTFVNCTCDHLSSFTVILNDAEAEFFAEPSTAENLSTYFGLIISLFFLAIAFIAFCLLGKEATNSNSIHQNITICLFCAQLLFLIALKTRHSLVQMEFPCKMMAIGLHYFWLCVFTWLLIEGIHLYRMLVEMGVINLGPMRYYYSAGYGLPLVIVGLSIGVRSDQYGNYFFCWLSIYESVVWALVGPIVALIAAILLVFFMAISASVKLSSDKALGHTKSISDTKTIKTLLFVGLLFLPILGTTWGLAVLSVSEDMEILHHFFSIMSAATSVYILIGYCLINGIARSSLVGYLTTGKPPYSKENSVTRASRTTFPYKDTFNINRRNIGISTASTTSRSTCKTSSSPYRTDGEMAMSNGNHHMSSSDVNSHSVKSPYAYNDSTTFHRKNNVGTNRRPSESESELSLEQQQSMELASSHTSDDDTTVHNGRLRVNERRHQGPPVPPKPAGGVSSAYLPNIYDLDSTSPEDQPIGPQLMPPDLPPTTSAGIPDVTVGGMSPSLRHNIKPLYAQHWSSQLPPAFPGIYSSDGEQPVTSPQWGVGGAGERLSTTTTSDNEVTDHGGGGDNLRVESRPLHTNFLNQRQFASPPSLPLQEGNYGTYSPKSKARFNPDIQKYPTLDHRAYSPAGGDARRYSPVVNAMGVPYTQDSKAQRSQDNLDALMLRTESRASRGSQRSVDSGGRGKYSPHPLYSGGDNGGSPLVQKRYLSNLVEDASPEELPAPPVRSASSTSSNPYHTNTLHPPSIPTPSSSSSNSSETYGQYPRQLNEGAPFPSSFLPPNLLTSHRLAPLTSGLSDSESSTETTV